MSVLYSTDRRSELAPNMHLYQICTQSVQSSQVQYQRALKKQGVREQWAGTKKLGQIDSLPALI
jgi:hypothetical protein